MNKLNCILLVDDDDTTNFVNELLLEDLKVTKEVCVTRNGEEALQMIGQECGENNCPQLVLLDINMPVMNGFEFLEAYNELDFSHKQSVVIVMLTTSMNPADVDRLQKLPIQGVVNKPLTKEKIQELLRQHFNQELPG